MYENYNKDGETTASCIKRQLNKFVATTLWLLDQSQYDKSEMVLLNNTSV